MATMFTNPYDAAIAQRDASQKRATQAGNVPWYRQGAVSGSLIGQDLGRNLGGMLGMQTPEQAKQNKIQEIMGQYGEGTKTPEQLRAIAGAFGNAGMMDLMQETLSMIKDSVGNIPKTSAAQLQTQSDMDDTIAFLEDSKGQTLTPKENAYLRARAKKDASLSMGGNVIDTAPHLFDQIISARSIKKGISDSSLTEAGLEKKVGELGERVFKADLSMLDESLAKAEAMIASYDGKDIPGLSKMNVFERMKAEGSKNATRVKSVSNILMKLRSGAAVTESEAERFADEISSAPIVTDELWIDWIGRIRALVDARKAEIYNGVPQEVIDLYKSRQGGKEKSNPNKKREISEAEQALLNKYGKK